MQFEEFDKKIKEASEHYHPAYDETAWKKMNQLLDQQLPENKDDWRRIYYFLFVLIFVTGVGYLLVEKPWNSNNKTHLSKNSISTKSSPTTRPVTSRDEIATSNTKTATKEHEPGSGSGSIPVKQSNFIPHNNKIAAGKDIISFNNNNRTSSKISNNKINTILTEENPNTVSNQRVPDVTGDDKKDITLQKHNEIIADNTLLPGTDNNSDSKNEVKQPTVESSTDVPLTKTKTKKQKSFVSNLGLTISAGPDISAVRSSDPGKTTLYYGAGLRYDISKRITLRTGFYITNKIYSAVGKDYKQTYTNYPSYTLTSVDAECKIFEVPLIINYNFIHNKRNNLFGSIGASSFFINRESYHYHYYDQMGQYRYSAKTYDNENKHYFSVVTLAAGYERKLNKIFSVTAEPYIKLPLSGVGDGKIKLNSAGLLIGINVKPFAEKEQKNNSITQ